MKKNLFGEIFSLPYREFFFSCFAANLAVAVTILVLQNNLPPVVPLLYQLPIGEEQLVSRIFLIIPSLAALLILAVNLFLLKISKDSFVQKVLVGLSIAITLLASITSIKIFLLVGSF